MTEEMRCARHPNETTNLTCSRCDRPVCVRCMVYTPVGIRCSECARERRSGLNAPTATNVIRALGAALGIAALAGLTWGVFSAYGFWLALLLGFGGGEILSLAANRRRGPELQAVAAVMVVGAFLVALAVANLRDDVLSGGVVIQTLLAGLAMVLAVVRQR